LENKSWKRCLLGIVPLVGNLVLGMVDSFNVPKTYEYKKLKKDPSELSKWPDADQIKFLTEHESYRRKFLKNASESVQEKFINQWIFNFSYASDSFKSDINYVKQLLEKQKGHSDKPDCAAAILYATTKENRAIIYRENRDLLEKTLKYLNVEEQKEFVKLDNTLIPHASRFVGDLLNPNMERKWVNTGMFGSYQYVPKKKTKPWK